nr:hypothetical protein [Candidatus Acidoferrales bacterium]
MLPAVAILAAWTATGCTAAFGPGYTVEKQRVEVSYTQQTPDRVSVRASYELKNTGTKPLGVLELQPPDSEIIQPQDLRVEWRGKTIEIPAPKPADNTVETLRAALPESWGIGESGEFLVSYDVKISPEKSTIGANHGAAFFLPSSGWLPALLPAHGAFATGGAPPAKWDLDVSVPEGYRVRASGENRGADKKAQGAGVRFEQLSGTNFDPYVAAGPYVEQQVHSSGRTVIFWTGSPLANTRSGQLGKLIAADDSFFSTEFGADEKNKSAVWVIECPQGAQSSQERPWISQTGCLTQPRSVVLPAEYFGANFGTGTPEASMKSVDLQLAATWLYFSARLGRYDALFPLAAVPDYAGLALAVSRNPESRNQVVRDLLRQVDAIPDASKQLAHVVAQDPPAVKDRARAESILFFFALEDRCGAKNVHKGLARASRLLRGETWGPADLRSAIEAECGGPVLDSFFREWMHSSQVPPEFRAKYSVAK